MADPDRSHLGLGVEGDSGLTPLTQLQRFYKHYHPYVFASPQVTGKRVLDLSAGTGEGPALLATHAEHVLALCNDDAGARRARRRFSLGNLDFTTGDVAGLRYHPDGPFDVVITFDLPTELGRARRRLALAEQLLVTGGVLITSTQELDADELSGLLGERFAEIRIWGQMPALGSLLVQPDESGMGEVATIIREGDGWTAGVKPVADRLLAVASSASLPELAAVSTLTDLGSEMHRTIDVERKKTAQRLHDLRQRYDEVLMALRREQRASDRFGRRQEQLLADARHAVTEADQWRRRHDELKKSRLYRFINRFRATVERLAPQGTLRRRVYSRLVSFLPGRIRPTWRRSREDDNAGVVEPTVPTVPMALEPEVTIVIPVHDQWALTAGCLASIASDYCAVGYEVVVVDDASDEDTAARLREVIGITLVRLDQNQGFVGAVNAGIAAARGRFIVLLNNDTVVRPGWLDALVATAESSPDVGVVGAKLVYPDGRLQEAGGIVWSDASGHNYGRDGDPDDPTFNFVREVDYCSGACLLVRRELLAAVGGLDTRFSPAYYEDTDLCFAARAHGYRVLYQPAATVCHLEGGTHGTDLDTGIKHQQVVNQAIFLEKWRSELARHAPPDPMFRRLSSWRTGAGRALVIDHQIPMPDHDSGSLRMSELLYLLRDLGLGVTLVPQNSVVIPQYRDALTVQGIEVLSGPHELDPYLKGVGSQLRVVILSRPTVAWANLPMIRSLVPETTIIYDTVDLHFVRERRRAAVEGSQAAKQSAEYHYDIELTLAKLTDQSWVISDQERDALHAEDSGLQVAVVPNIHRDEPSGLSFEHREGILFVGSYSHHPNRDAAHWLVEEILPLVRSRVGEVTLYLVGSYPTDDILALADEGVTVLGWVKNLEEIYQRTRVFAAPLRYGAGMKGKIGESLAYGVPVVTTTVGAEGIGLRHGHDVLIADDADAFAGALADAYVSKVLWQRLAANGRETISQNYSPGSVKVRLSAILSELGVPVGRH